MKQTQIRTAALLAVLAPASSVMAHAEITGQSGIMSAVHDLVHALQASPGLGVAVLAVIVALFIISRINKRES